ncbi:MAG: type IV pilus assembly protein PilM [Patescibacteria group bacterium]
MDNPLKTIFGNIEKMIKGTEDGAVGIDIGTSAIKVVEIKKKGGRVILETYGIIELGPYADLDIGATTNLSVEKIADALKEVLKQSSVSSNSGVLSIPVQSSLIFTIQLPSQVKADEMLSIVSIEARKYIPVPIAEVSLDYFVLPNKEASFEELNREHVEEVKIDKMNVLVVATQNDAVAKFRSILAECKIESPFFEIEIFSSIRSNFEHELSPVLLIDFGASRTKLSIVEFGMVKSFHSIERGGAYITESISKSLSMSFAEAEKIKKEFGLYGSPTEKSLADVIKIHIDYIMSETNNVLLSYEKKYNRTISKVIFSGGGALMKGLKEVSANNFQAEIEIGHPFSKVKTPEFLQKVLDTMGPEFAVAMGLALRKLQ